MHKIGKRIAAAALAAAFAIGAVAVSAEDALPDGTQSTAAAPVGTFADVELVRADVTGEAPIRELTAADEKVAETDKLALYLDREAFGLKVLNKESGYVWRSILPDDELEGLSATWQQFAQSMLVADILNISSSVSSQVPSKAEGVPAPEITLTDSGFRAKVYFSQADASCDMVVSLTDTGLSVEIPSDSIACGERFAVSALYIMPFFGATYSDDIPGYFFVPDGSGALIRFDKPRSTVSPYTARIYGPDYGITLQNPAGAAATVDEVPRVEDEQALLPVFGVAHGGDQDAFLAVVSDGDASCEIVASPAGTVIDYSWISPRFVFWETYFQPTSTATGFNTIQPEKNDISPRMDYCFLSGEDANYTGMAVRYREMLIEEGTLTPSEESGDIPIKLDAFLAEQANGFWGDVTKCMTTFEDISRWVGELGGMGVQNLQMTLLGFEPKGVSGHTLGSYKLEKKAGSEKELQTLYDELQAAGGQLIFQTDLTAGYEHQIGRRDYKIMVSRQPVTTMEVHPLYQTKYYASEEALAGYVSEIAGLPAYQKALALDGIGRQLYSDNLSDSYQLRPAVLEERAATLAAAQESSDYLLLESPNLYAFPYADGIYNVPVSNSRLIYETDSVPFLQIVLSGCLDTYVSYLNLGGDIQSLLTLIDYGSYPSYILSEAYSSEFADTNSSHIYSSRYEDWKEDIASGYALVNGILSQVRGSSIISRDIPQDGISVVGYDNGKTIVVNYTDSAYTYQGTTVGAQSAEIIGEGTK